MKNSFRVITIYIVLSLSGVVVAQTSPPNGVQESSTSEPQESSTSVPQEPPSNWTHQCDKSKRCYVYSGGSTRLVFSKKTGKSNKSMRASVILPLGLEVGSPVTLHIDGQRNLMLEVTSCNKKLCEAQIKEQYAIKLAEQLAVEPSLDVASSIAGVISIESIDMVGYVAQLYKM